MMCIAWTQIGDQKAGFGLGTAKIVLETVSAMSAISIRAKSAVKTISTKEAMKPAVLARKLLVNPMILIAKSYALFDVSTTICVATSNVRHVKRTMNCVGIVVLKTCHTFFVQIVTQTRFATTFAITTVVPLAQPPSF